MTDKSLFVVLALAVFSVTTARLLSIREGRQAYDDRSRLALTVARCPEARSWLSERSRNGTISNDDYDELARWTLKREDGQSRDFLTSGEPVTCHALKDWRQPS